MVIGAVLTQNTAWTNVEKALAALEDAAVLHDGAALLALPEAELAELIRASGFYQVKARRLRALLTFFQDYAFDFSLLQRQPLEVLRPALLAVHGVGAETADSILLYALDKASFVVDAYTRRIFSRLGLLEDSMSYEQVRAFFMDALPGECALFNEYHALIVRAAKEWCHKRHPLCAECPLPCATLQPEAV